MKIFSRPRYFDIVKVTLILFAMPFSAFAQWPGQNSGQSTNNDGWPAPVITGVPNPVQPNISTGGFRCSVFGEFSFQGRPRLGQRDPRIDRMIEDIVSVTGLAKNFEVYSSPDVGNAAAWVDGDTRIIAYNPNFMNEMLGSTGTEWSVRSILAHEVGHHLQGHTIQAGGSRPTIELEADNYSGAAVRWLGGTEEEAKVAMSVLAPERGSNTHPGRRDRLTAISRGWQDAGDSRGATGRETSERQPRIPFPTQIPSPAPAATCNGFYGPMCALVTPLPVGAPCVCYLLGQPVATGIAF